MCSEADFYIPELVDRQSRKPLIEVEVDKTG